MFEKIKQFYKLELYSKKDIDIFLKAGYITKNEYKKIVN